MSRQGDRPSPWVRSESISSPWSIIGGHPFHDLHPEKGRREICLDGGPIGRAGGSEKGSSRGVGGRERERGPPIPPFGSRMPPDLRVHTTHRPRKCLSLSVSFRFVDPLFPPPGWTSKGVAGREKESLILDRSVPSSQPREKKKRDRILIPWRKNGVREAVVRSSGGFSGGCSSSLQPRERQRQRERKRGWNGLDEMQVYEGVDGFGCVDRLIPPQSSRAFTNKSRNTASNRSREDRARGKHAMKCMSKPSGAQRRSGFANGNAKLSGNVFGSPVAPKRGSVQVRDRRRTRRDNSHIFAIGDVNLSRRRDGDAWNHANRFFVRENTLERTILGDPVLTT